MIRLAANLSMLFTELDFLDRFEAAARAGFKGVEFLFPYAYSPEQIKQKLDACGLEQVLFNMPPGNWGAGERGIACHPDRVEEFQAGVVRAIEYARVLGNPQVNCLAGIIPDGLDYRTAEDTFIANLKYAGAELEEAGIRLVMEAINTRDIPGFFLNTTAQAMAIRERVASANLALQYDIYHMQIMEGDLARTIETNIAAIEHFQLADNPGRHEPGTGEINYPFLLPWIDALGYQGWISCEYKPLTTTEDGLGWLSSFLEANTSSVAATTRTAY